MELAPLHLAATKGSYDIIKILLDNGADISAVDKVSPSLLPFFDIFIRII